jgi:hypothetical protein
MGSMFGDAQGLWFGQIKNLPRGVRTRHCRGKDGTAA